METIDNVPWFDPGLKFQCTGCGKCCTGSPGYVFLSSSDLQRIAEHLHLSEEEVLKRYAYQVDDRYSLRDIAPSYDCVFLKDKKCTIYEARPTQCKTFPWWIHHLKTPEDWEEAARRCEGINHPEAEEVPSLHIQEQCMTYLDNIVEQNFSFDSDNISDTNIRDC